MSEQQPPPGYVPEPPTEPGWYRVWHPRFEISPYRVTQVYRPKYISELHTGNGYLLSSLDWHWGPKVEF